ncbi:ATP-binding protein [Halomonas sp. PAMB 3264]|uniref:ATP-binding protein n=1 Tax=Halomonas sp. PAMB 3264 TaxID=3075222 RepID=UPI0028A24629|nr:ATP-binding protein [Halomonas sp. PAMB 3264]WNL42523.1 ATP-binding protein [Halomonas sp. PAMB 3264]
MKRLFVSGRYAQLALTFLLAPLTAWGQTTFDEFFQNSPSPMWMVAVDDGEIVRANPAAKAFYGYPNLEKMQIDQINTFTPEQLRAEIQLASRQERNHLIFRHRLADGSTRLVGVYTQPYQWQGEAVLLSSLYDMSAVDGVTGRRYVATIEEQVDLQTMELEHARERTRWLWIGSALAQGIVIVLLALALWRLRGAQRERTRLIDELSFRNHELERISQAMAHHFQEPSRRLVSFSHQLKRLPPEVLDDSSNVAVGFINTQAQRLSELVSDVQRYLSLDQTPLTLERLDVERIIDELYQRDPLLGPLRDQKALLIDHPLPEAFFDRKQLGLIFKLLLHNAWQYRQPSRPLTVEISGKVVRGRAQYRVADNGQGIAPEYRRQVFEMFNRLVPNGDAYPGTGVGLAILVKLLRKADGQITIEDGRDGGACFVFDLPLPGEKRQ